MNRFSLLVPAVLVLGTLVPIALGQTGPTGPVSNPTPAVTPTAKQSVAATPDNLAQFLRDEGYQVEIRNVQNSNDKIVIATVSRDGWHFVLEFEYMRGAINLVCPLGNSNPQYSANQWRALMQKNFELPVPMHFSFRASDQRLILEDPLHNAATMSGQYVRELVTRMIAKARETHPLWGNPAGQATTNSQPAPKTPTAPVAPQNPNPAPQAGHNLTATTWVGSETLGDYGRLEFRFHANGKVSMIDTDGTTHGIYSIQNNVVTLRFFDGAVVYSGTINGSSMNGTAQNSLTTWSFSVKKS